MYFVPCSAHAQGQGLARGRYLGVSWINGIWIFHLFGGQTLSFSLQVSDCAGWHEKTRLTTPRKGPFKASACLWAFSHSFFGPTVALFASLEYFLSFLEFPLSTQHKSIKSACLACILLSAVQTRAWWSTVQSDKGLSRVARTAWPQKCYYNLW